MNIFLVAAILLLGIARLTLILVRDDIAEPLRKLVFRFSPPEGQKYRAGYIDGLGKYVGHIDEVKAGWWGQVFSCPDCMGPYVSAATLVGYYYLPTATLYVMMVLAASMMTSLIARRY